MIDIEKYNFSFTSTALRVTELEKVIKHLFFNEELDITNNLGNGNTSTGKKVLFDLKKRIEHLDLEIIQLFINSDYQTQKNIAYISICKAYGFIRDFVIEVLREKFLVFDYNITEGDFITFYRRKSELHSEMENLTVDTQYKIKQITFKILEQSGIIDSVKTKNIQPQLLNNKLISTITMDDRQWLKIFFISDTDIENIKI